MTTLTADNRSLAEGIDTGPQRAHNLGAGMLVRATEELSAKKIVVVGLGISGAAVARFAIKCGATVLVTDSRPASEVPVSEELIGLGAEFVPDTVAESMLVGADMVVASPGVPRSAQLLIAAKERGVEIVSDIELASRYIDVPIIAVAGTNGKSTVVTLIGEIMEAAGKSLFIGGNIGIPVTEYFNLDTRPDLCLLEVSSFQLEHIDTFAPRVAVMLNITEDHLERYDGFDDYAATKLAIFDKQGADCLAVVNAGDLKIASILTVRGTGFVGHPPNAPRVVPFTITGTIGDGLYLRESGIVYAGAEAGEGEVYSTEMCSLKGLHNIENMMAAIAVARLLHIDKEIIEEVLSRFKGLSHRMETVRTLGGVTYIDDSKGTNVGALKMALKGIDSPVVLIAGGVDKGGDYSVLLPLVKEKVERMILIGESRHKMERALGNVTDTVMAETIEEAVRVAHESAKDGMVVLLCPAGASFDMFKNYAERGERFSSSVMALKAGNGSEGEVPADEEPIESQVSGESWDLGARNKEK